MVKLISTIRGKKDKNDELLQEFVASKNWKQALNHCEKRLKKGEATERLLLNKASILLHTGDKSKENEGITELRKLLDRRPPITDGEVLIAVEEVCNGLPALGYNVSDRADTMWERAAKERPKDESILQLWFATKFGQRNFKAAQKAAMTHSAKFKDRRRPFYCAIMTLHLASTASDVSQAERNLFASLAHRLLTDAVGLARNHKDGLGTGDASLSTPQANGGKGASDKSRAIQGPDDLQLLVEVYQHQRRYQEAISILNDPDIGISSKLGQSSWELIRERIKLYELSESWEEVWQSCYDLLLRAGPDGNKSTEHVHFIDAGMFGNDWVVWTAMIRASTKIQTEENSNRTKALISSYLENGRKSRNSRLAMIEFFISDPASLKEDTTGLLSALLAYYYDYSASPMCFQDLRSAQLLPLSKRREFLVQVARYAGAIQYQENDTESARASYIYSEINSLKQDYTLIVSVEASYADKALFEHFISNCLRLFKLALPIGASLPASERRPGDDAAILAAMGCVHLYNMGEKRALLRSAVILEVLLSNSSHNYDALLLIIRIYFCLGAVSEGIGHYLKLDIKHIQYLTNSWVLFTRISTIHPHAVQSATPGSDKALSPAALLSSAMIWSERNDAFAEAGVAKFMNYDSVVNLLKHLDYAEISGMGPMIKYQFMAEMQRISRLGHSKPEPKIKFPQDPPDFTIGDVRDRSSFPNYEALGEPSFEDYIQSGPMPDRAWLINQLLVVELTQAMAGVYSIPSHNVKDLDSEGMTREERSAAKWTRHLARILSMSVEARGPDRETFCQAIKNPGNTIPWLQTSENLAKDPTYLAQKFSFDLAAPNWHYFHVVYTFMEQCSLTWSCLRTISLINRVNNYFPDQKYIDDQATGFGAIGKEVHHQFHIGASRLRTTLRKPAALTAWKAAVLDPVEGRDDPVGVELRKLVDDESIDIMGTTMLGSWLEGLDGVLRTEALDLGAKIK
ncbi:hypothetical protein MMC30_004699 [Trapelia coarctata]|nr:hypothetical protein [Trapelia coarctata]